MGQFTANISRNMHDARNRYLTIITQQGMVPMDADFNDQFDSFIDYLRIALMTSAGDGSPNNGFKIVGTGATNDFTIKGGDGTFDGAGVMVIKGYPVYLYGDITYNGTPVAGLAGEDQRSIFPRVTGVSYDAVSNKTTITDSAANYATGELVGRVITPDVDTPANSYPIIGNTATTIEVSGDITANVTVGRRYRLGLTTPSANRTDGVFLNVYLDEVDSTEDTNLVHSVTLPSPASFEAARRKRMEATIFVREDTTTHGNFTSYTDSDGNVHSVVKIATINRTASISTIDANMVVDLRRSINPGGIQAPVGTITAFGGSTAPTGWLICDGASLLITDFPDLYNVIGTSYGTGGAGTFNLPDLRGKIPFGLNASDADFQNLGQTGGTKDSTHTHSISGSTDPAGAHNHGGLTNTTLVESFVGNFGRAAGSTTIPQFGINTEPDHTHGINLTSGSAGSSNGNLNPYVVTNYIIKF